MIIQPLIITHSSYTTHHTPLIIHHSSYTSHHAPLIIHHSSYTTHHTLLIIQFALPPVGSSVNSSSSNKLLVLIALAPVSSGFNSSSSRQLQLQATPAPGAGAALCEPPCADFVAGTALFAPLCADFVAGAIQNALWRDSERTKCRIFQWNRWLRSWQVKVCGTTVARRSRVILGHGRNRPSIRIRVFTCFLKCRFRGRHSTL